MVVIVDGFPHYINDTPNSDYNNNDEDNNDEGGNNGCLIVIIGIALGLLFWYIIIKTMYA